MKSRKRERERPRPWVALGRAALLAAVTVLAYLPAAGAGFIWDDDDYVSENRTLREENGLARIWFELGATPQYYPLAFTTFLVEYRAHGLDPAAFHVTNIALHAGGAVLLYFALRALALPGALFLAALWSLHPLQVESVAWISERKNVLSGLFYLAAALAWLRIDRIGAGGKDAAGRRWPWYLLSFALFACALLSKTVTVSLPVALVIICWWRRRPVGGRLLAALAPFAAAGAAASAVTVWMEKHHVAASGVAWDFSLVERCLIAGRAFWFYLARTIAPFDLSFIYTRWTIDAARWWQYLFPAGALALVAALWLLRRRVGRGPLAALLFFAVTVAPALGFIDIYPMRYSFVADHFQYLAGIGPIVLAGSMLRRAAGRLRFPDAAPVAAALVLAGLTWARAGVYVDQETLWRDTIAKNRECWMAYNNLGIALQERGDLDGALRCYERSLEIEPKNARPLSNAGTILLDRGRTGEAIERFRDAARLNPGFVDARFNLGRAFETAGRADSAIACYRAVLDLRSSHANARYNLANLLARSGSTAEAIEHYRRVLDAEPANVPALVNLGNTYAMEERFDEAAEAYRRALRLRPDHALAHRNLGNVLAETGHPAEAAEQYRRAAELRPDWPELNEAADELRQQQKKPENGEP